MKITEKTVVSINYTLKGDDGSVIDSSDGKEPLQFLYGVGMIIPGLEKALEGFSAGDSFKVTVAPQDGYGERRDDLVQVVPAKDLEHLKDLEVGAALQAETDDGQAISLVVTEISKDGYTLDGNHPLSGENLHFEGEVVEVRAATEEEMEHGHSH